DFAPSVGSTRRAYPRGVSSTLSRTPMAAEGKPRLGLFGQTMAVGGESFPSLRCLLMSRGSNPVSSRRNQRSRMKTDNVLKRHSLWIEPLEDRRLLSTVSFIKNIGTNTNYTVNSTSMSITVPAGGVEKGHSIIVELSMDPKAGTVGATDSAGNTYTVD